MSKISKKIRIKPQSIIIYVLLILCLLGCNTVYSTCVTRAYRFPELTILFLLVLVMMNIKHLSYSIITNWFLIFIPYYLLNFIIIFFSVSSDKIISYSVRFLLFVPFLVLVILNDARRKNIWNIALKYENLVICYASVSLVLWILVCILNVVPATGQIVSSWGGEKTYPIYFGIFTTRQTQEFMGRVWIRNQGFFAEGPMYNLVLIIAVCIEAFIAPLNRKKGKYIWNGMDLRKIVILVIADISTFTITGMILLVGICVFKYCLMPSKSALIGVIKWIGAIVVLILALYTVNNLFLIKADTGSWEVRFDDFIAGYKAWKHSIWFGNGYDTMDTITHYMSSRRSYNMGYSSGIFSILAQGGIALFINYLVGFGGYIRYSLKNHKYELIAMLIITILILATSLFHYTFVMLLFLAYGYSLLFNRTLTMRKNRLDGINGSKK